MSLAISRIDHIALTASDLFVTERFYREVLGAEAVHDYVIDGVLIARQFRLGGALLNIHQAGHGHSLVAARPMPGSADICFGWAASIATAVDHLRDRRIVIEEGPVARIGSEGLPGQSVYFRDPDGNLLELLSTSGNVAPETGPGATQVDRDCAAM